MAMPRKQDTKVVVTKSRGVRHHHKPQGSPSPTSQQKFGEPLKITLPTGSNSKPCSPVPISTAPRTPPRTPPLSPGLLNMHYAACKFAEPPKPSSLPLPPLHWMQAKKPSVMMPFRATPIKPVFEHNRDVTQQLKLLLKVQA